MEKETWFPGHPTSANQPDTRVAGRDDSPTDPPGRKPVWSWKRALCPTLSSHQLPILKILQLVFLLLLALVRPSASVSVDFENCLSPNIVNSKLTPKPLQFIPQYAWSKFDTGAPSHNLNVTVYGDIDGLATNTSRPTDDDERWQQPNVTLGKIVDEDQANDHRSTFFARFNVLDYTPYDAPASAFCENVIPGHQPCPLIPIRAFNKTRRKVSA